MGTSKPQSNGIIGTLAVDGWAVTFNTARRGLVGLGPPPSPLLALPNVTAHPSAASVPTSCYSVWHCDCLLIVCVVVMCSIYGLISYVFRFTSAWIIIVFTVERYLGICRPLDQHVLAMGQHRKSFAVRSLCVVISLALAISVYKPFFMTPRVVDNIPVK